MTRESFTSSAKPSLAYDTKPYNPEAYGDPDYHPSHDSTYKRAMRERFPQNTVRALPWSERGPLPPTVPDQVIRSHKLLCECEPCRADYVGELKRIGVRRARARAAKSAPVVDHPAEPHLPDVAEEESEG